MEEAYSPQQYLGDINTRLRDLEEKQKLLNERAVLTAKTVIDEREKNFSEIQAMKKTLFQLKEEVSKMRDFLQRTSEQLNTIARKEELSILQRQFDLFRNK